MSTITVASTGELMAALAGAAGGETILLAAGDYGQFGLWSGRDSFAKFASEVTIQSADPSHPASFSYLGLDGVENLTFDSITFDYSAAPGTVDWDHQFLLINSSNITIQNSTFDGDLAEGTGTVLDGQGTGWGLYVSQSTGITVENSEFYNFARAALFADVDGLVVKDNDVHDIRSDGFDFAAVSNVSIVGNHIHDFHVPEGSGDHPDMIQFWTEGTTRPSSNIVISGNFLESGAGSETQTIFMNNEAVHEHGAGQGMFYQNVTIENNVIYNGHLHGITVGEAEGLTIQNNTLLQNPDLATGDSISVPTININAASTGVLVANNIVPWLSISPAAGQVVQDNLIVQSDNPQLPNYVGDLFVDPLIGAEATLFDLQALPGSVVALTGVGASLSQFDLGQANLAGFVSCSGGTGLDLLRQSFDATNIFGSEGKIDLAGAQVAWDFGDGTTADGFQVTHAFSHAGKYEVTGTIQLANGQSVQIAKTISVDTPVAIYADFNAGAQDLSDRANSVSIDEDVTFETHGDGSAVRLNGGLITYQSNAEISRNSEFSVLIDFKKDLNSDGGRLLAYSGSVVIDLGATSLQVGITTDRGTLYLNPKSIGIGDSEWHSLALTFSGTDGVVDLYLDGNLIAHAAGLEGAVQDNGNRLLSLGDPWGDAGFRGLIDNFAILRGALNSEQVAQGFSALHTMIGAIEDSTGLVIENKKVAASGHLSGALELDGPATQTISGQYGVVEVDALGRWTYTLDCANECVAALSSRSSGLTDTVKVTLANGAQQNIVVSILGTDDDQTLTASVAGQMLMGGDGNDTYLFGGYANVKVDDVGGIDKITSTVTRSLAGFANVENLELLGKKAINGTGNDLANIIVGNAANNVLTGGKGNDTLAGGAGTDTLDGGEGDDLLIADSGADNLKGGAGNDAYQLGNNTSSFKITDTSGIDTITSTATRSISSFTSIENLTLLGTGNVKGTGNGLANTITGNSGNNVLDGAGGADTLVGGEGNDTYLLSNGNDTVIDSGGVDTITSSISRGLVDYADIENLTLTGSSAISGTGNGLANIIKGNAAANVLSGGAGDDRLSGDKGNDVLIGGLGADMLTGGAGNDVFRFLSIDEMGMDTVRDVIIDFKIGQDKIDLGALDSLLGGPAESLSYLGAGAFTGEAGEVHFVNGTGITIVEGDMNGDAVADFQIELSGSIKLTASSFLL